jgi:hypothetical protein
MMALVTAANCFAPVLVNSYRFGASAFDPTTYGTVKWWVAARKESFNDGDAVGTITDWSSSAINATQATSSKKPTFKTSIVNALPIFRADGVDDTMAPASNPVSASTAVTLFMVMKDYADPPGAADSAPLIAWGTDSLNDHLPYSNGSVYYGFAAAARHAMGDPATTLAQFNVITVISKSGGYTLWINGSQFYTSASNTVGMGSAPKLFGNSTQWQGDLAEVIIYDGDIGSTNRAAVEAALKSLYGTP